MIFPIDKDPTAKGLCNLPSAAKTSKGAAGSACSSALGHTDPLSHPTSQVLSPYPQTDLPSSRKVKDI